MSEVREPQVGEVWRYKDYSGDYEECEIVGEGRLGADGVRRWPVWNGTHSIVWE